MPAPWLSVVRHQEQREGRALAVGEKEQHDGRVQREDGLLAAAGHFQEETLVLLLFSRMVHRGAVRIGWVVSNQASRLLFIN